MKRIAGVLLSLILLVSSGFAFADAQQFKFGILKLKSDGNYEMDTVTTQIPMRLKETGFRFGISFDNPSGGSIEWYEVVHLPRPLKEVSGNLKMSSEKILKSDTQSGNDVHVVDQFWFDKGDPLGAHSLEVYVNGVSKFKVDFEVIK